MKEKEEVVNSQPSSSTTSKKNMIRLIMVWIFVLLAGMLGIVLLVATKTVAGLSCIGIALTIALPLHRVIHKHQTLKWSRITAILIFSAITIQSIATTDYPPNEVIFGYRFLDQIAYIGKTFLNNISGGK